MNEFKSFAILIIQNQNSLKILSSKHSSNNEAFLSKLDLDSSSSKENQLNYLCSIIPLKIFEDVHTWKFIHQFEDIYPFQKKLPIRAKLFVLHASQEIETSLSNFGFKLTFIPEIIRSSKESDVRKFYLRCMQALAGGYETPLDVESNLLTESDKQELLKE